MSRRRSTTSDQAALGVLLAWSLAWKAASMWRAARNDDKPWFVVLLLVNSAGLLDAFYLFVVGRKRAVRSSD